MKLNDLIEELNKIKETHGGDISVSTLDIDFNYSPSLLYSSVKSVIVEPIDNSDIECSYDSDITNTFILIN